MPRGCALVLAALVVAAGGAARAEGLTPEDLARKNERGYVTGLPLFAYSTDIGFGGGARLYYYWNGARTDPRFATTPYLHRVFLQAFVSTAGIQFHWLDYDAPQLFATPYRVRSQLIFIRNKNSNYFGLGDAALLPLAFPGSAATYDDYAAYAADQQRASGGMAWTKYDQFDLIRPLWLASVERSFFADKVRLLAGFGVSYARIDDYTGEDVYAVDATGAEVDAVQAPTRLQEDCAAGLVEGCGGGRDHYLRLGVAYDTRDFEPDPNSGVFADLGVDVGTVALGSEYDYVRALATARGYWSPIPAHADLVLAARGLVQVSTSGVPFFSMSTLPFTDDPRGGLGGHRTLRGYRETRFVGPAMAAFTAEVRWTFTRFRLWRQKFGLIAAPFFDVGRSFDGLGDLTFADWRPSYGAALRISWNLATILTADYGVSSEDSGLYLNFGHIF
jgi:hypothetical protein